MSNPISAGSIAVFVYRFGRVSKKIPFPISLPFNLFYFILFYLIQTFFGISVQQYARIGRGFKIKNSGNIFIVAESIGKNFVVSQGVTVGNVRGSKRLPIIGSNVYVEPGAKILGEVVIGDNVTVRANSLVLSDVPANSVACGNPARVKLKEKYAVDPCVKQAIKAPKKTSKIDIDLELT